MTDIYKQYIKRKKLWKAKQLVNTYAPETLTPTSMNMVYEIMSNQMFKVINTERMLKLRTDLEKNFGAYKTRVEQTLD